MVITVHMANKIRNKTKPKLSSLETKLLNEVADRLEESEKQTVVAE